MAEHDDPSRADMVLYRRACKAAWPMSDKTRIWVLRQTLKLLKKSADDRVRVAAARTIMAGDALNIRQQMAELARLKLDMEKPADTNLPTAADLARELMQAAEAYESAGPQGGDQGGAAGLPEGPGPVQ